MADVIFRLDAEQAKAVNSFLRVVDSQRKSERQFKKTTNAARDQDRMLDRAGKTVGKLGRGLLALGGVGSVAGVLSQVSRGLDEAARASTGFEREIRPLLSLGDNFKNIEDIRKQVLSGSTGLGRGSKEVTDAFFALQSGASNLSDEVRNDLFRSASQLAFLQNGDLAGSVNLLVKFYQNYGDRVKNVTDLSDKLFATADRGALTLDELAKLGPDVAASAKIMGISLEELLGTFIVTTQQLGKNEKTFTGVRNVILRMANAQREGIQLTGTFTDKLQQLSRVDPETLKRVFGDEAIAAIAVASKNAGAIKGEVDSLNRSAGELSGKIQGIIRDQKQLAQINLASAEQARTNARAGDLPQNVLDFALQKADIATGISTSILGQVQPESLTNAQASIAASLLTFDDFLREKGLPFGLSTLAPGFNLFGVKGGLEAQQSIGESRRLNAQFDAAPEIGLANIRPRGSDASPSGGINVDSFDRAATKLERAAESLQRTANRRSTTAQVE